MPLSNSWFAHIFSQTMPCLFILSTTSFTVPQENAFKFDVVSLFSPLWIMLLESYLGTCHQVLHSKAFLVYYLLSDL
jgi:hypothetical protein